MIRALIFATIVALGCSGDGTAGPNPAKPVANPAANKEKAVAEKQLEWSMKKNADGKSLAISIKVANTTGAPIWVADRLVAPGAGGKLARTDRLTVMNTDDPATIRFVVGAVSSDSPAAALYGATFTRVGAGESVSRSYTVPMPLASWNPVGGTSPLSTSAKQIKLFVHTSSSDPTEWSTPASSDHEALKIPQWGRALTILASDPQPLP